MKGFFFLLFSAIIAVFCAMAVAWNITDIVRQGPNFWNIFWLALVGFICFVRTSK